MIFVIQCAASKRGSAGSLVTTRGSRVMFVAKPEESPDDRQCVYAHPDAMSDSGISWRNLLLNYNRSPGHNPLGLLPAWKLYQNPSYSGLVKKFGPERVYILSAGWGLISANFLTPNYNITFSSKADKEYRRGKRDCYRDLCMLPPGCKGPIVFCGGKDYVRIFCDLTRPFKCRKIVLYNSVIPPRAPGCDLERFSTTTRTNWHYECANRFIEGKINIRCD